MSGIITNILRTAMIALGAWLVTKQGVDQATADAATDALTTIGGAVIAGAGAIWSLLRSVRRAKEGVE
jgi:hypothetical protein